MVKQKPHVLTARLILSTAPLVDRMFRSCEPYIAKTTFGHTHSYGEPSKDLLRHITNISTVTHATLTLGSSQRHRHVPSGQRQTFEL